MQAPPFAYGTQLEKALNVTDEIERLEARLSQLRTELRAPLEEEALSASPVELLTCEVGEQRVAFLIAGINEVVPMPTTAPLPGAPPWVTGLIDLRGQLIAVVDVEARIRRTQRIARASDFVVICANGAPPMGLVVRRINKVVAVEPEQLEHPPAEVTFAPYTVRVTRDEHRMVPLLSVERLRQTSEIPPMPT